MIEVTAGRACVVVRVEVPTRAEVLRDGRRVSDGWRSGIASEYVWQGRRWLVPPRRGEPELVYFECESPGLTPSPPPWSRPAC